MHARAPPPDPLLIRPLKSEVTMDTGSDDDDDVVVGHHWQHFYGARFFVLSSLLFLSPPPPRTKGWSNWGVSHQINLPLRSPVREMGTNEGTEECNAMDETATAMRSFGISVVEVRATWRWRSSSWADWIAWRAAAAAAVRFFHFIQLQRFISYRALCTTLFHMHAHYCVHWRKYAL